MHLYKNGEVIPIETFYLIDYENVNSEGLTGCNKLGKSDHIVIFFTKNAKKIDMSEIADHGEADMDMCEVPAGKQSTDIHIGSYLGYLAGRYGGQCNVVIVSKDTDYDKVIKFWKNKTGINASRSKQIKKVSQNTKEVTKQTRKLTNTGKVTTKVDGKKKTELNQEVMKAVRNAGYDGTVANNVAQISAGMYGDERLLSNVHNALKELYSNSNEVYYVVKPVLSKYVENPHTCNTETSEHPNSKLEVNNAIMKTLSKAGYINDVVTFVASTAVKNYDEKNGKQQTYRSIVSKYGQAEGLDIYNYVKKLL